MSEPLQKKMKYDHVPKLYQFGVGYVSEDDNTVLLNNNENNTLKNIPIMHFQTVEGADIYIIANMKYNFINLDINHVIDSYIDINKGYTLNEIFTKLMNGNFSIGTIQHYGRNHYYKGIISNIRKFEDEDNYEIKLHYTKTRDYPKNIVWRTLSWDLFEEYVPETI